MARQLTAPEILALREELALIGDYMADRDYDSAETEILSTYATLGVEPPQEGSKLKKLVAIYEEGSV